MTKELPEELKMIEEMIKLRISVARIAQALGVAGPMQEMAYEELWKRAATTQRGWNALCGDIMGEIQDMQFMTKGDRDE